MWAENNHEGGQAGYLFPDACNKNNNGNNYM